MKLNNNNNNTKEITTTFVFNDVDIACIAAIEYVIYLYGNKLWFNAALNKIVTDIYLKTDKEICHIPFIILKVGGEKPLLFYKSYHYIIYQIEKYNKKYK